MELYNRKCVCGEQHTWQLMVSTASGDSTIRFLTTCPKMRQYPSGWIEIPNKGKLVKLVKDIPFNIKHRYHIVCTEDSYSGVYVVSTTDETGNLIAKYIESPIDLSDSIDELHTLEILERMGINGAADSK